MTYALLLAAAAAATLPPPVVVGRLERPALAMAFVGADRLLVVDAEQITTWKLGATSLTLESSLAAPPAVERVRQPAALVHAPQGERGAWVLRSGWAQAILIGWDDGALEVESTADALPWPRASNGVRYRAGTGLAEGPLTDLARGPYVALSPDGTVAVDPDGRLVLGARPEAEPRVGSALVRPWPELIIAASAAAHAPDALLFLRPGTPRPLARIEVAGLVRAMAARVDGSTAIVLAAVEDEQGHAIVRLDARRTAGTR